MSLNLRTVVLFSFLCALPSCTGTGASGESDPAEALETEDEKVLYVLGQYLGQGLPPSAISEDELGPVRLGLADSVAGREPRVDLDTYFPLLNAFMNERIALANSTPSPEAEAELAASMAFVEEKAAEEGSVQTSSGLVIQEITQGTGESPAATDAVTVHYHGTLRDGSVFDSSVERGEPATFLLNQVIPCWTEGVQLMKVGGQSRLICPPDLAYGPAGQPGIPGNSALVFVVELLEIIQ